MRLRSPQRAERLFRRVPRFTLLSGVELLLLALIAVQAARLVWTLVTPVGPVGDWRPSGAFAAAPGDAALTRFDPFFRLSAQSGPAVVTGLNLTLFGVREDRATGHGSAIIALPDGSQRSFAVGEEILPGVTLAEVGFDNVTINRAGAREQIFLAQSEVASPAVTAAPAATPLPGAPSPVAPPPRPAPTSTSPPAVRLEPRVANDRIDGLTVSPGADGGLAFQAAGFAPGDVIVSINSQRVTSIDQARTLVRGAGGQVNVIVNRGGRAVPMRVRLNL